METADTVVAVVAQEPTNGSCDDAVINGESFAVSAGSVRSADGARTTLLGEHPVVGAQLNAESPAEMHVGVSAGVSPGPLADGLCVGGGVASVARKSDGVRAVFTPWLPTVSPFRVAMKLIHWLYDATLLASLLGRRHIWRWFGMLLAPSPMPVGGRTGSAPAGKSVTVTSVHVKPFARLRLAALRAELGFHSCSPFLPIIPAGMV